MRIVIRCGLLLLLAAYAATGAAQTSQAYYKDGSDKFIAKDYQGALAAFDKALGLDPRYTDAWYFRGMTKLILKDSTAADDFSTVIELDPQRARAWAYRGMTKFREEHYTAALPDFNKAVALDPNYDEAWFYLGNCNMQLKNYYAAVAYFDKAVALRPGYTGAIYSRGITRYMLHKYADAVSDFNLSIAQNPDYSTKAYYYRGMCRIALDQQALACPDLKTATDAGVPDAAAMWKKYCRPTSAP